MEQLQTRIGFGFLPVNARSGVETIARAEAAGFGTAWTVMPALGRDTMTLLAAAAMQTNTIRLGTSIVPAFTRHPLALVTQVLALEDLAPGRIRIGIGTSRKQMMVAAFGLPFERPLAQLREYVQVLSAAFHTGKVDFEGDHFTAHAEFPAAPGTPVLVSALGDGAWDLAGELSDGGISWNTPHQYLTDVAKPAMTRAAERVGRSVPPVIAHVLVSAEPNRDIVRAAVRESLGFYANATFYQRMFAAAGFPLAEGNMVTDALIDALTVSGDSRAIADGLQERLDGGIDELIVNVVPVHDQRAAEDAVFTAVSAL